MKPLVNKLKPTSGFAHFLHLALQLLLPLIVFILLRLNLNFVQLALSIVVLSKWRMFAVRPRFWPANIRANAVDLMVGLSVVLFMDHSASLMMQLVWTVLYAVWLISLKPGTSLIMVSIQAFIGQLCALMALFLAWSAGPVIGLTFMTGLICFLAARHFFDSFDEPYARLLSYIWGYFGAALAWLLSHWLLFYHVLAQPTLLLSTLGYGLAVLYYLDHNDRLSKGVRQQFIFIMIAVVLVVLVFSDWGNKVV
ncbi:MAG TPA: hypothetical protein VHB51_04320 [Candidatus Saccharimonadales bacterium]|nr:hypothetical protein [Candidatus Saccharimonadales bacterium]